MLRISKLILSTAQPSPADLESVCKKFAQSNKCRVTVKPCRVTGETSFK